MKKETNPSRRNFFNILFNNVSSSLAVLNKNFEVLEVNDEWKKHYDKIGFPHPNFGIGMSFEEIYSSEPCNKCEYIVNMSQAFKKLSSKKVLNEDFINIYQCRITNDWHKVRVKTVKFGKNIGYLIEHEDIRELKDVEQTLKDTESKLRSIFNRSSQSIIILDENQKVLEFNTLAKHRAKTVFGKDIKTGVSIYYYIPLEGMNAFENGFRSALNGKSFRIERKIITADNKESWFEIFFEPMPDEKGRVKAVSFILTPIDEYKNIENNLVECREQLKIISDYIYNWEYWRGKNGNFLYVSPSCERITGYTVEDFMKKPDLLEKIIHPDDKSLFSSHFKKETDGCEKENAFFRIITRDGQERWINHVCQPVLSAAGKVIGCRASNSDVTEQVKAEEKMKQLIVALKIARELTDERSKEIMKLNKHISQSEARLKELNSAKDKFFSIIAHDIKSPFQGFLSLTKLLLEDQSKMKKGEVHELAAALYESAENLFKLLQNLLQWSRMQRGMIEFQPENFNLFKIIDINVKLLAANTSQKKITITNNVKENMNVFADLNMTDTIIRNLLSNAIKFTKPEGSIIIIAKTVDKSMLEISIKDDGIGMDAEMIEGLFKIDTHRSYPGTANETGTGLGLILCKDMVDKNGGRIRVESKLNKGSTFRFTLPKGKRTYSSFKF